MFIISLLNEPPLLWVPLNLSPSLLPALRSVSFFQEPGCSMEIAPVCVCVHMCAVLLSLSYFLLKLITPLWILVLFSAFPALGPLGHVVPLGLGL